MAKSDLVRIELGRKLKDDLQIVEQSLIETTANVVGTSYKGPAFVPITFSSYNEFETIFGRSDGENEYSFPCDSCCYDFAINDFWSIY